MPDVRIGSFREVPNDVLSDIDHIRREISGSGAARVYRANPIAFRIVGYLIAGAIIAVLIVLELPNIGLMIPPRG